MKIFIERLLIIDFPLKFPSTFLLISNAAVITADNTYFIERPGHQPKQNTLTVSSCKPILRYRRDDSKTTH